MNDLNHENEIRKTLGMKPLPVPKNYKQQKNPIEDRLPKSNKSKTRKQPEIKADFQGIKFLAKIIKKQLDKNRIPKEHSQVIALRDELRNQEQLQVEKQQAIQEIKELRAREKTRQKLKKLVRREKIKRFLHIG